MIVIAVVSGCGFVRVFNLGGFEKVLRLILISRSMNIKGLGTRARSEDDDDDDDCLVSPPGKASSRGLICLKLSLFLML